MVGQVGASGLKERGSSTQQASVSITDCSCPRARLDQPPLGSSCDAFLRTATKLPRRDSGRRARRWWRGQDAANLTALLLWCIERATEEYCLECHLTWF